MHIAKCEGCEKEIKFETYKHDWPVGWILTGKSRWGKKYHRRSGWAWWCPECDKHKIYLNEILDKLPIPVQRALRRRIEFAEALDAAEESSTKMDWRLNATIDRLISNIPAACKVLLEEGYVSLAGQLARDQRNLIYWQERGVLTFQQHPEEPISNIQSPISNIQEENP